MNTFLDIKEKPVELIQKTGDSYISFQYFSLQKYLSYVMSPDGVFDIFLEHPFSYYDENRSVVNTVLPGEEIIVIRFNFMPSSRTIDNLRTDVLCYFNLEKDLLITMDYFNVRNKRMRKTFFNEDEFYNRKEDIELLSPDKMRWPSFSNPDIGYSIIDDFVLLIESGLWKS